MAFCEYCAARLRAGSTICAPCYKYVTAPPVFDSETGQRLDQMTYAALAAERNKLQQPGDVLPVEFEVRGPVVGKPRQTRQDKWKQRPRVMRYRDWSTKCRASCERANGGSIPSAASIATCSWIAAITPPKSRHGKRLSAEDREALVGLRAWSKPDRDNIDKALLDSLWPEDDSAIACGRLSKVFSFRPRLCVTLEIEV